MENKSSILCGLGIDISPSICALCGKKMEYGANGNAHFQCIIEKITREEVLRILKEKGLIDE